MLKPMMIVLLAGTCAVAATASPCDSDVLTSRRAALRIVSSLHPDKPGQARVVAVDSSEYTAGESVWMRNELRAVDRACTRDDVDDARQHLRAVEGLLRSHGSLKNPAGRS